MLDHDLRHAVLHWLEAFIAAESTSEPQRALLATALIGLREAIDESERTNVSFPPIDLPLGVYASVTGSAEPHLLLAAACALVFLSLDIFDDLADGDRKAHWGDRAPTELNLAAATVLALPPLILARLDIEAERRSRLQEILTRGLLRMSAGQQADVAMTDGRDITPEAVEAAVIGKSGGQCATYCALAATMAGAGSSIVALYESFGRELGTAGQLASDCQELLVDPECRDLAHGTRTLPIVFHLHRLSGRERANFLDLLDRARGDPAARQSVLDALRDTAEIRRILFGAQLRIERARRLLGEAQPFAPGKDWLAAVLDGPLRKR